MCLSAFLQLAEELFHRTFGPSLIQHISGGVVLALHEPADLSGIGLYEALNTA
ncbi:hypothetical protein D3C79_1047560 [compost metagenome]